MKTSKNLGRPAVPASGAAPLVAPLARWWRGLRASPARLNLALQGGGAHGAFTWGVLDRLLEDPQLQLEGLSGSSAGAMNAIALADGWMKGGREGARAALTAFWSAVGGQMSSTLVTQGDGDAIDLSPAAKMMASWASHFSPWQLNPFDLNPLRDLLTQQIDFAGLRRHSPFKLFVGTTRVSTGKLRVFREHELSVDVLLASACLPKIHQAVEIDGDAYWDGGYSANPAVFPLFYDCDARDVLLVLLSPATRPDTPRTVESIDARIVELAFSAHFLREMRMFAHAVEYAGSGFFSRGRLERRLQEIHFHLIDTGDLASLRRTGTQLLAYAPFLERLHAQGRESAGAWLLAHARHVGQRSTVDVKKSFG